MKLKKVMLVVLLLLAILTISAVSASDEANFNETLTVDNADEVSIDTSIDNEIISESDDDVVVAVSDDEVISEDSDDIVASSKGEVISNELASVSVSDIYEGDVATIFYHGADGVVAITVDGISYNVDVVDGIATLQISDLPVGTYTVHAGGVTATFSVSPIENSTGNIIVITDEIITDSENEDYDENICIAEIILPPDTEEGRFNAFVDGEVLFNKDIEDDESGWYTDESGNLKCQVTLKDIILDYLQDDAGVEFSFWVGDEKIEEFTRFMRVHVTDSTIRFYNEESDEEGDAEDGVIIYVPNGDDRAYNLDDDLDVPFAFISVSDEFSETCHIRMWDVDIQGNGGFIFFEEELSELNGEPDDENEGFTIYSISLSDFRDGGLVNLLNSRYLKIEFFEVDENNDYTEIDSREYNVDYDEEENAILFWEL